MKQVLITISSLFFILLSALAQKEVYFNTTKSEDIKVESMHGIETRLSLLPSEYISKLFSFPNNFNGSFYIGYFNEKRIADCWTLNTTIGFQNIALKTYNLQFISDSINGNYIGVVGSKTAYSLMLEAGIEPRWYYGYKNRYRIGKARLNSGWYLSFPLTIRTNILQTPEPLLNQGWFPKYLSGSLILTPTLGYKQAISDRFFFESSLGLGVISTFGTNSYGSFNVNIPYLYPTVSVKLGYKFK